jgi:hypothetical protein
MPALIGLSPRLADHTFPRDDHELRLVCQAIGNLSEPVEKRSVHILSTEFFRTLLAEFKWGGNGTLKNQIMTHLNLWLLGGHAVKVNTDIGDRPYTPHPIPAGCHTQQGLEELWADELGKLLVLHDDHTRNGEYFIGIACEKAFAGEKVSPFEAHTRPRFFPLVGPKNCDCTKTKETILADAYEYKVPPGYTQTEVTFEAGKKNIHLLGGDVRTPTRGSHYSVKFEGARTWRLDPNDDPVPETYLRQLVEVTGLPFETITYTLREGKLPPFRLRFDDSVG